MIHESIIAAVSAPDYEPRYFDEAQRMTFEQMRSYSLLAERVRVDGSRLDSATFCMPINPRHRWIARWTTRTGKALARKLWGAA